MRGRAVEGLVNAERAIWVVLGSLRGMGGAMAGQLRWSLGSVLGALSCGGDQGWSGISSLRSARRPLGG